MTYHAQCFHCPKNLCSIHPSIFSSLPHPSSHWCFCCLHSFTFSRMSYGWNHAVLYSLQIDSSLSNVHLRFHVFSQGFPNGPVVKNPPAKQKICIRSLGRKDPLEKEMAAHSSILAWEIPQTEEPGGLPVHGVTKESGMTWQLSNNSTPLSVS